MPVSGINEKIVARFITEVVRGVGGVSCKEFSRIYQVINNVLVYAKDMELGAPLLDWGKVRRYIPDGSLSPYGRQYFAIPESDIETLMVAVFKKVYPLKQSACFCLVLNFYLGLRVGELASLTWPDIDLKGCTVRIYKTEVKTCSRDDEGNRCGTMTYRVVEDTKTLHSFRELPLVPDAVRILKRLKDHHRRCGYASPFLAYDGTDCILVRSLDRTLRRLCSLCGINSFSTHCIRKTFATMLHASGMPTRYISDLLGHAEMRTTERNYILTYADNHGELLHYMESGLAFNVQDS